MQQEQFVLTRLSHRDQDKTDLRKRQDVVDFSLLFISTLYN